MNTESDREVETWLDRLDWFDRLALAVVVATGIGWVFIALHFIMHW